MNKIKMYVSNKLPLEKQTHEVEEYAKKHNIEIINLSPAAPQVPDDFYNLKSRKRYTPQDTAIIYTRFSSSNQQEISITGQLNVCLEYTQKESIPVCAIYVDMSQSGRSDNRIGFMTMNSHIAEERYNGFTLITYQSNRLFRNRKSSASYKLLYENYGIKFASVTSPKYEGASGAFLEAIQEGADQYFSDILSDAVIRGLKERAAQCRYTGGYVTYGYKINPETKQYEICENEAENVRLLFNMYINKKGYTQILRVLDSRGAVTRNGKNFTKAILSDMLMNEKYNGVYTYNKSSSQDELGRRNSHKTKDNSEIIRIPGGVPAIVDQKTFELAQKLKEANKHGTKNKRQKEDYLLTGLVYCAECGSAYTGNRRFSGRNKTKYVTYRCTNHNKGEKCNCKEVNKDYIEEYVLNLIVDNVLAPEKFNELLTQFKAKNVGAEKIHSEKIKAYAREKQKLETEKENLFSYLEKGLADDMILERLSTKNAEIQRVQYELENLKTHPPRPIDEKAFKKLINKTKEVIKKRNSDELRKFIRYYVEKIIVGKDDVKVILSFSKIVLMLGGGEGSRTPVQRSGNTVFYERSRWLIIPLCARATAGLHIR